MTNEPKDIVEDLRNRANFLLLSRMHPFYKEAAKLDRMAADEIEKLRSALNHAWEMGIARSAIPIVKDALGKYRFTPSSSNDS